MASSSTRMSTLTQELSSAEEGWQDLVAWDGELYDPLFQGDMGIAATSNDNIYNGSFTSTVQAPESVTSEQSYVPSTATSIFEGPSSFDYAVSRPPSVTEGPPSFGHGHSWLSGSPSYTTSATSPLAVQAGIPFQGSFDACETMLSPQRMSTASPFFDAQSNGSSGSYQTASASGIFNPYLAGSPHAFSGLDVYASQTLDNVGTWVEPSVEPIIEVHQEDDGFETTGTIPIPIPQSGPQRFSNTFSSHPWIDHSSYRSPSSQARAITIPQPHPRNADAQQGQHSRVPLERHPSLGNQPQNWSRRVPPLLSVSPEQRRLPRSAPLTRSLSNPRRGRNSRLSTPSPTSTNFGWVSYQPNTNNRLVPLGAEGGRGRRQRGRVGALTAQQRSHAALMRLIGSCSNCKKRKEKCDPGIPCKSCLDHFKGDLVNHPCRDRLLSDLAGVFFTERHGWHPTARALEACVGNYQVQPGFPFSVPIIFGFGSALNIPVCTIQFDNADTALYHEHIIYSWPPSASLGETRTHAVLPAILTPEAMSNIEEMLDNHLTLLVDKHFSSFPLFCSPLRILRHVYVFCRSLPTNSSYSRLLHQALKLLVLVHVGGDITLSPSLSDPNLEHLLRTTVSVEGVIPTPCFIRSQFGSIMPRLALKLMREVLLSLEQLFLNRECHEWPAAVATLIVVLMVVESIQYHAAKLPYHHSHDSPMARSRSKQEHDFRGDDEGVRQLLDFYSACFSGCHARLDPDWQGDAKALARPSNAKSVQAMPEDKFIENIRGAIRDATPEYLEAKATAERMGDDMSYFFDRLAARLLVLKTHDTSAPASQNDVV
ncbi:hypothetical protein N0V90_003095 [Kalmusia sp. IMI 367209]|nr:hypothetical protein N0V90_003095 [Kalmusia sp. IMI 367209]